MGVYRFENNSLIDEVTVHHTDGGGVRAYLHARTDCSSDQLNAIKNALTARSMQWTPIHEDGKPVLEVRGFGKHENELLKLLQEKGAVLGGYKKLPTVGDEASFTDKLKKNTLKASGYSYFIGDAGFLTYGWKEAFEKNKAGKLELAKPQGIYAGIFYALGTPFIAFFGRGDKSDIQLKHLSYNMLREFDHKKIDVPHDASVRAVANGHNTTTWKKIISFCMRYPAEITNSLFAVAGSMVLWMGAKDYKSFTQQMAKTGKSSYDKTSILMDVGLGAMTMLAGLISVFVEEERPKPGEPKKTGLARAWQFIKEKPLRAAGVALGISTLSHAGSTVIAYKKAGRILENRSQYTPEIIEKAQSNKSALLGRGVFVATNLTAEILMAMSSKGHGAGVISDRSLDRSSYAIAADLMLRTPEAKRDAMLKNLTGFLAGKEHLGGDAAVHEKGILKQFDDISKNPWTGLAPCPPAKAGMEQTPASYWQDKVTPPAAALTSSPTLH